MKSLSTNFKTVESIVCEECGKTHKRDSNSYVTVYGNICVGENGGILGGGNWDYCGVPVNVMCRGCFIDFVTKETV